MKLSKNLEVSFFIIIFVIELKKYIDYGFTKV